MTPNGDGISDHGDVLECMSDRCRFKLRVGYYEKAKHVICPLCGDVVVRPCNPIIRARRLRKETERRKKQQLARALLLEEEARQLRRDAGQ